MPRQFQKQIGALAAVGLVIVCVLAARGEVGASTIPAQRDSVGSSRPAGLVQAGDSKTPCIDAPLGTTLHQAESATGLTFNCIESYNNSVWSWSQWASPWLTHPQYGYRSWLKSDPGRRTIVLAENLIPEREASNPDWREQGAAGDFDKYARLLAENLVSAGFGYSVIRLGPEMNGKWENDNLGHNRIQWHRWAAYFVQIVRTMRSVEGAHFLFDWNVNAGTWATVPLRDYYPGNAYVDIVGLDLYDTSGLALPPVGSPDRWEALIHEPMGLTEVYNFATEHHKPLSFPEWATLWSQGDDGNYVMHMGEFISSHTVAYQSWFDAGDDDIYQLSRSEAPHSVAAYVRTISH